MHLLDSTIAFAAIVLAACLIVTAGTQLTIGFLGLRGANLRRSLADLFESACDDGDARRHAKVIARRVLRHPLLSGSVFSRFGIRIEDLPFVPADAGGKLRWAGSGIPFQSWLLGALGGCFIWPATLAAINALTSIDIRPLSSVVVGYVPLLSFTEHPWRTGAIVGAVLGGLIGRWRLATSVRADELVAVLEKLSTPPGGSLPDPAQRAMLVIAGEAQRGPRSKINTAAAEFDKFVRELPKSDEDDIAVAEEKLAKQVSGQIEPELAGVNSWFDHAMDRASQRFTLQARVITVVLSVVLVFAAHLDAIRLFRMLSSDSEMQSQLNASADLIMKQAGQMSKTREDEAGRQVVPDIYRKAMVDILQSVPNNAEQTKKPVHSPRHSATPAQVSSEALTGRSPAELPDAVRTVAFQEPVDGALVLPTALPASEAPAKEPAHRSSKAPRAKSAAPEMPKSSANPAEDTVMLDAKARASKALETVPGFASREDAVSWLRGALNSDPAADILIANYEQAVNSQLVSDGDKLIDQSASLKHELSSSELQLFPEKWPGWKPANNELPGFLVALALLSLGTPVCYNLLKRVASLRPLLSTGASIRPDRRIQREDRRIPPMREQARAQTRPPENLPEKKGDKRELAISGQTDRLR